MKFSHICIGGRKKGKEKILTLNKEVNRKKKKYHLNFW